MRARIIVLLLALAAAQPTPSAEPALLTFTKVFEDSAPNYIYVAVRETGRAFYKGQPEEEPREFQLSSGTVSRLFGFAASLGYFRDLALESRYRVAYMGKKTFTYEQGGQKSSVSFNYTENEDAKELQRWFEAIARGRYLYEQLEARLRYDRLGIIPVIRELERDFNSGQIVDPQQFAPLLQQVAQDPQIARLARTRAGELLRRIQGAPPRFQLELVEKPTGRYYRLVVDEPGGTAYEARLLAEQPNLQPWRVPAPAVARLRELLQLADNLRGLRAADDEQAPVLYRFTYESGAEHNLAVFVQPPNAIVAEMVHVFRQIIQQDFVERRLAMAVKGEGEMLLVVLKDMEAVLARDGVIAPQDFVPQLEAIVSDANYDGVTRQQAERVLAQLRGSSRSRP
ncbi:MAG TPA: hypothetical protein VNN18_06585 [Candidatus Xenobia bacterium]|nr:hypothetical protein [Candidatus Xenobia bacterium]